jgi:hypothetical protein
VADLRTVWINLAAAAVGGAFVGFGVRDLADQISVGATFLAVFGFLIIGWAALDYRRYRPAPAEELGEGRTVE